MRKCKRTANCTDSVRQDLCVLQHKSKRCLKSGEMQTHVQSWCCECNHLTTWSCPNSHAASITEGGHLTAVCGDWARASISAGNLPRAASSHNSSTEVLITALQNFSSPPIREVLRSMASPLFHNEMARAQHADNGKKTAAVFSPQVHAWIQHTPLNNGSDAHCKCILKKSLLSKSSFRC
jgi:hypothetical protein